MAVMLRTHGMAARVVNGFLPGEYNEAAGAYTVRQSDAHSWVEVYFPRTNSWVTFDPTPPAGRVAKTRSGLVGALSKYSEALEFVWFQYVVGYDKQEQRSVATSLRKDLIDLRRDSANRFAQFSAILPSLGKPTMIVVISIGVLFSIGFLSRRVRHLGWLRGLKVWQSESRAGIPKVDFYER